MSGLYNNMFGLKSSRRRDILLSSFSTLLFVVLVYKFIYSQMVSFINGLTSGDIISLSVLIVTTVGIIWQTSEHYSKKIPHLFLSLQANVIDGKYAIISSEIQNISKVRIVPSNVYLYIDEGIKQENGAYKFPFLLKHEKEEYDCILSDFCQRELNKYPKERLSHEYENIYTACVPLEHLSKSSILYIDPDEHFCDDVVIEFPKPGVYRAILIFTAKDADCSCSSKQFVIN